MIFKFFNMKLNFKKAHRFLQVTWLVLSNVMLMVQLKEIRDMLLLQVFSLVLERTLLEHFQYIMRYHVFLILKLW